MGLFLVELSHHGASCVHYDCTRRLRGRLRSARCSSAGVTARLVTSLNNLKSMSIIDSNYFPGCRLLRRTYESIKEMPLVPPTGSPPYCTIVSANCTSHNDIYLLRRHGHLYLVLRWKDNLYRKYRWLRHLDWHSRRDVWSGFGRPRIKPSRANQLDVSGCKFGLCISHGSLRGGFAPMTYSSLHANEPCNLGVADRIS